MLHFLPDAEKASTSHSITNSRPTNDLYLVDLIVESLIVPFNGICFGGVGHCVVIYTLVHVPQSIVFKHRGFCLPRECPWYDSTYILRTIRRQYCFSMVDE